MNAIASTTMGVKWNTRAIRNGHGLLRAIDHKLRQRILDLLNEGRKLTVTEVYIKLRLEQSVASQHLAILRRAGLISGKREGKNVYYTIIYDNLSRAHDAIEAFNNWP